MYIYSTKGCVESCITNTFENPRITKLGEFLRDYQHNHTEDVSEWRREN